MTSLAVGRATRTVYYAIRTRHLQFVGLKCHFQKAKVLRCCGRLRLVAGGT